MTVWMKSYIIRSCNLKVIMDGIGRTKFNFESEVREVNIERLEISVLQGASLNVR